jgi:hypothetical protein
MKSYFRLIKSLLFAAVFSAVAARAQTDGKAGGELLLNGTWQTGLDRNYTRQITVPGLVQNAEEMSPGTLWYRRTIELPKGDWTEATLCLKGARFAPVVYVDGEKVSSSEGGMAPTEHLLKSTQVAPGETIELEIALQSLKNLNPQDASAVPVADRWRSDISSSLWDDVRLHFSRGGRISRIVPWTDFSKDSVSVHWEIAGDETASSGRTIQFFVSDQSGRVVASSKLTGAQTGKGVTELLLNDACKPWTPESPNVYRLKMVLAEGGRVQDSREVSWGLRDFRTEGLSFKLNGEPVQLRGGSVVWHRWLRDPEATTLAFDPGWFETNIVLRLKGLGANFLRFHLGLPPESFLDLCDRDGLMVQMEWPFFHGVKASPESMEKQWRSWLDVGMHHPCVVLIHPWNETEGDELKKAWSAMNDILPEYPPLVISHRDVIPIHKCWWSLFENVGLYYDSATQFDRPIMVDEFGGNYLDGNGDIGTDPVVRESLLRFLGRDQTRARRLAFQAEATAKIAEYWRRLGAAGLAPFCILSSPQDGNTWFLDELKDGSPKPVWTAMSAAYAPLSVSLEVWDRNYSPGQAVTLPLYFFNDTDNDETLNASVRVVSGEAKGREVSTQTIAELVPAHSTRKIDVHVKMPPEEGGWRFEAELNNPARASTAPIVSTWDCRTMKVELPPALRGVNVGLSDEDAELLHFCDQNRIHAVALDDAKARVLVLSAPLWAKLPQSPALLRTLQNAVTRGQSVVLLDIGPRDLGQGYKKGDLGPLEGAPRITDPNIEHDNLFSGIQLTFREVAEPESHLHPAQNDDSLWASLPRESTWLWNGLRGGLVVPCADMEVAGLSSSAFLSLWASRGADETAISNGNEYYAYELAGYYAFSSKCNDKAVIGKLRDKVKLLFEDAPALQNRINPNAPVVSNNIAQAYHQSTGESLATELIPLASCGKNLTRIPIVELGFGPARGKVILSQVLTAGRLVRGCQEPGLYGIRYDPAAEQFTLSLIARALNHLTEAKR